MAAAPHDRWQSEDHFARIFHNSPLAIIVQSRRSRVVLDVNPAFERLYGYSRAEYIGTAHGERNWASRADYEAFVAQLDATGRVINFRAGCLRKDGSRFDGQISSELEDAGPEPIVVSTIADVTLAVKAQSEARQSQELFAKAFDFSPLNMSITRVSDGTFLAVNSAENTVQGYTAAELIGRTALDTGSWLNPAERDDFIEALRAHGQVLRYETQMRHKDGHLVDCMVWAVIVEVGGEPCVLSSTINITEQKRREGQLVELARGVSGETGEKLFPILVRHLANVLDADMVMAGEMAARDDGTPCIRSLGLVQAGETMPPATYALDGTPCGEVMAHNGLYAFQGELSRQFPADPLLDGQYTAYAGMALRDADGTPIGILKAAWRVPLPAASDRELLFSIFASRANAELVRLRAGREIQRLNQTLERRVKDRTSELEASNAELESFSYSVSHDLKAPLSSIDGFTALLLRRMGARMDPEEQRMFERIRTNTARMHELIEALLSLAQVSRHKLALQEVDLSALAAEWFEAEQAREPGRTVRAVVQPGLKAICDRRMARVVLENLLGNAWKYSRRNPFARIEFGVARTGDGGERSEFYIKDNGVGFDMAHEGHLFKPFHRLHNMSEYDGSGIGLATVHRILERHGGSIRADSSVDSGATFHFSFEPRRRA